MGNTFFKEKRTDTYEDLSESLIAKTPRSIKTSSTSRERSNTSVKKVHFQQTLLVQSERRQYNWSTLQST